MSRNRILGLFAVAVASAGATLLFAQERPKAFPPGQYSVVTGASYPMMVEQGTGKTWLLHDSASPAQAAWVPIPRFDDENDYKTWLEKRAKIEQARKRADAAINKLAELLVQERLLLQEFGQNHPEVKKIRSEIRALQDMKPVTPSND